jgi:hypothetical protein
MPPWPTMAVMSDHHQRDMIKWWAMLLAGVAAALLFAWLGHLAGVTMSTLLAIGAGGVGLAWLIVLVTVPWNLYFAARQAAAQMPVSRGRGIEVAPELDAEATKLARRMLWFAVCAHAASAAVTAIITYVSGRAVGYYFAGFFLLSTVVRPALAYLTHVRDRITVLTKESTFPRDDVGTLKATMRTLEHTVREVRTEQNRLATDRSAAWSRVDDLERRLERMARRIENALDGIGDHQEVVTGIRALARIFRSDPA